MEGCEYQVYWLSEEKWWQCHLDALKECTERNSDLFLQAAEAMGFDSIFRIFSETRSPELKAVAYYLAAELAKTATDRHAMSYLSLKQLYLLSPINAEESVWITTAMHVAKIPKEEQAWLNAQPCPCDSLPHGFAWE